MTRAEAEHSASAEIRRGAFPTVKRDDRTPRTISSWFPTQFQRKNPTEMIRQRIRRGLTRSRRDVAKGIFDGLFQA
jgi:hypothetical protein